MNKKKNQMLVMLLTTALCFSIPYTGSAASAAALEVGAQLTLPAALTNELQLEVKSLLNEHTYSGTRIAAVVKLTNHSSSLARVPDGELRAVMNDDKAFVLRPSANNVKAVESGATVELSYMVLLDRKQDITLNELAWVDINKDVYPKVETTLLSVPVKGLSWKGIDDSLSEPEFTKKWEESFSIPSLASPLVYTPIRLTEERDGTKRVQLLTLRVQNPSDRTELIPDFTINGRSDKQIYAGNRADKSVKSLDAGSQKYMYFSIPTDQDTVLTGLNIMTPESYQPAARTADAELPPAVSYSVGRLHIGLSAVTGSQPVAEATELIAPNYSLQQPLAFDPLNVIVDPALAVSVMHVQIFENEGQGYKTAVVKLKMTNSSSKPLTVPDFGTELVSTAGSAYSGKKPTSKIEVAPNASLVVAYTFLLPLSEQNRQFSLRVYDEQTAAPYKTVIARADLQVERELEVPANQLSLYPYDIDLKNWSVSNYVLSNAATFTLNYTYKLKLDLDVHPTDNLVTNTAFSKLAFELENTDGKKVASKIVDLAGENRIINGSQIYYLNTALSEQLEYPLTLKLYEMIDTPSGPARRLLKVLK
ncbi:hypothetical protein [Paenibacillus radicis (ex Xue et al. 2023)]|uniref:DUF4139 domain-containing protein n=1 Tax=Paenibacillus radicis (ex Xue et al. 2023) TaxID=2972489 RepID=A0ABT1YML3_9BACL|nr:hypothetical protein [Paenibacillus radicis (ex Xue et al. 2023)]MCR8633644.1 hypothetical protein [Paenibacillus radicis (ex Xue et al. 2023)]